APIIRPTSRKRCVKRRCSSRPPLCCLPFDRRLPRRWLRRLVSLPEISWLEPHQRLEPSPERKPKDESVLTAEACYSSRPRLSASAYSGETRLSTIRASAA